MGEQGAQQPPPARALQPRWPRSPGNPDPWDTAPSSRGLSLGQGGQSGCPRGGRGEAGWAGENPAPRAPSQPLGKAASVSLLALSHDQKVQKKEIGQRYLEGGNALGLLSKNFAHTNSIIITLQEKFKEWRGVHHPRSSFECVKLKIEEKELIEFQKPKGLYSFLFPHFHTLWSKRDQIYLPACSS